MKGASYDLWKDTAVPATGSAIAGTVKRMKSSSVEVKWMAPFKWCSRNFVTICLLCFSGLMFPVCKFIVCAWDSILGTICSIYQVSLFIIFSKFKQFYQFDPLNRLLFLFLLYKTRAFGKISKRNNVTDYKLYKIALVLIFLRGNLTKSNHNINSYLSTVSSDSPHCTIHFVDPIWHLELATYQFFLLFQDANWFGKEWY